MMEETGSVRRRQTQWTSGKCSCCLSRVRRGCSVAIAHDEISLHRGWHDFGRLIDMRPIPQNPSLRAQSHHNRSMALMFLPGLMTTVFLDKTTRRIVTVDLVELWPKGQPPCHLCVEVTCPVSNSEVGIASVHQQTRGLSRVFCIVT